MTITRRAAAAFVVAALTSCFLVLVPTLQTPAQAGTSCAGSHWIATWTASPSDAVTVGSRDLQPALVTGRQSFRMVVVPHRGGSQIRVHLTNRFARTPVTFGQVTAGLKGPGASLKVGTLRQVTFKGDRSVTIPAGEDVVSDPVRLTIRAFEPVAISYFVPRLTLLPTEHFNANQTSYYSLPTGQDLSGSESASGFTQKVTSWYWISGLDVRAPKRATTVVAFGDSITDGFVGSSLLGVPSSSEPVDKDVRYPDFLQRRLSDAGIPLTTVNAGISGNRLLQPGLIPQFGPSAIDRITPDAANVPGATNTIILIGINDLGQPPAPTTQQMKQGYITLIKALHAKNIHVLLGTVLPSGNATLYGPITAPGLETTRQQLNRWIRTQRISDGIVDFDKAMRSATNPKVLNPDYASPDNLHPNPRGYRAMARAVPLHALKTPC